MDLKSTVLSERSQTMCSSLGPFIWHSGRGGRQGQKSDQWLPGAGRGAWPPRGRGMTHSVSHCAGGHTDSHNAEYWHLRTALKLLSINYFSINRISGRTKKSLSHIYTSRRYGKPKECWQLLRHPTASPLNRTLFLDLLYTLCTCVYEGDHQNIFLTMAMNGF